MPVELRLRLSLHSIESCTREMPRFHSFVEDPHFVSDGGPDAVDEMTLGFIEIRKILRELLPRHLDIDQFAFRIAILVKCRIGFFDEIAAIRGLRRIINPSEKARLLEKRRFGGLRRWGGEQQYSYRGATVRRQIPQLTRLDEISRSGRTGLPSSPGDPLQGYRRNQK
jgi:Methylmalonyl-CoA mutase